MADDNDLSGKVGLDTTGFKTGVSELNSQIRNIETGFRASAAVMGSWSEKSEGLTLRTDSLTEKLTLQKQKLSILHDEYNKAITAEEKDEKAIASLANQMYSAEKAISATESDIKKYNTQLDNMQNESSDAATETKHLNNSLDDVGKNNFATKIKSSMNTLSSSISTGIKVSVAAIAGMATATAAAAAGVYKLADKASDLNEAQNVVTETFDKSSEEIIAWTDTISKSAGISKTAATTYVGSMGAMLKSSGLSENAASSMSKKIVQLTGDMSSFYNLDNETAWEKIRSGISGETEPLKQLGINMSVANLEAYALSSGITKAYSSMSQAEQTTLRYNYLLSVTTDAQGDYIRTSSGMANQSRNTTLLIDNLTTSLGLLVMPSVNAFLIDLNDTLGKLTNSLTSAVKSGDFSEMGTIISDGISNIINKISSSADKFVPVVSKVITGIISAVITALPQLLPSLTDGIVTLINTITTVLSQNGPLLIQAGVRAISTLIAGLLQNLPQIQQASYDIIIALVNSLSEQLPTLISVAVDTIIQLVNGMINNIPMLIDAALNIIMALVDGLMQAMPKMHEAAPKVIMGLISGIVDALPKLIEAAPQIIVSIIMGIINSLPQLIMEAPQIIIAIITGIIQAIPQLLMLGPKILKGVWDGLKDQNWGEIGSNMIKGIVNGFSNAWSYVKDGIKKAGNSIVDGFKDFFGIQSPATLPILVDGVGGNVGKGAMNGVIKGVNSMAKQAQSAFYGAVNFTGGNAGITSNGQSQSSITNYNQYGAQQQVIKVDISGERVSTVITPTVSNKMATSSLNKRGAIGYA